jgi:hypothetical protein
MSICDPSLNAAVPSWLSPIGSQLTPAMQAWAASIVAAGTAPQNSILKQWFGALPIAALVNCHTFTVNPDGSQTAGLFYGVSIYKILDASQYPPTPIDWPLVATTGALAAAVVAAFLLAIHGAGRAARS